MMSRFLFSGWAFIGLSAALANAAPVPASSPAQNPRMAAKAERMTAWRGLRFGLFIHWGPYSQLGGAYDGKVYPGNTEWIMRSAAISRADYREAAKQFDPKEYDPAAIVSFAKDCGFKYIVMTAKHYDGFAMFDSKASDFNSVAVLPSKRDLLKEFSKACQDGKMPLGFSYAVDRDWYNPGGNTLGAPWDESQKGSHDAYLQKVVLPQLHELMSNYGPVLTLMADTGSRIPAALAPAFEQAIPPAVAMPRDFAGNSDYFYTDGMVRGFSTVQTDWEQCTTMGDSWGYRKGHVSWQSADRILNELVTTAGRGGNYLLNVGLDGDGKIPEGAQAELQKVGVWLSQYGAAIYGSRKSPFASHPWQGTATVVDEGSKGSSLYLFLFGHEKHDSISLPSLVTGPQSAEVMGTGERLPVRGMPGHWEIDTARVNPRRDITVLKVRLPEAPVLGPGPAVPAERGIIKLQLSEGIYASRHTTLGRTPDSSDLQLTSFSDSKETGDWQIYSPSAVKVQLSLKAAASLPSEEKKLVIWLNNKKAGEILIKPEEPGAKASPTFSSTSFRLPAGASQLRIAGVENDENSQSISTSEIDLVPCN